jgi:ketosteroid isomerase-like protein
MSQANVEVVKEFSRLFETGDREGWRPYFDPEVVWDTSASELPEAGVYHGHAGIEDFFGRWLPTWTDYRVVTNEVIDAGDAVVVVFHQSGTGRGSGVRTERDFFGIYDMKDSKVVRFRLFESRQEALEAAGLFT